MAQSVWRLGYGLNGPGFEYRQGEDIFFTPKRPDRLWGPTSIVFNDEHAKSVHTGWAEQFPPIRNMKEMPRKQVGSSETQQNSWARKHARTHTTKEF